MTLAQLYLSPSGRINRQTWWLKFLVPTVVVSWGVAAVDHFAGAGGMALGFWYIAILWSSIVMTIKRWHDADKSGWWLLVLFVPLLGMIWNFIQCGILQGTTGPNRFGADPNAGVHGQLDAPDRAA
jgi:uncharacterized membrane protein YhaH (DUF805 family)